jgi:hypothetical protein
VKALVAGLVLLTLCATAGSARAENPRLGNGTLDARPVSGGLEASVRGLVKAATAPTWIGWSVATDREHQMCCWESWNDDRCCYGCRLEGKGPISTTDATPGTVKLEAGREMLVLLRAETSEITKLRTVSSECPLDGGGTTLHWLTGVPAAESVRFLQTLMVDSSARDARKLADQALSALAFHAEASAVDALIERASHAADTRLRGQALFWLAQRAGDKAVRAIKVALDEDPETEVKKKAVFALSQLPKDEGVPLLIQTARNNANPAVRKQAFFWLGQSKDPRALQFFEQILK